MATPTTLPASFTSGQVLTAAQMNNLRGAFRILQVVQTFKNDIFSTTSTSYTDVTGFNATITPTSTSSLILVDVNFSASFAATGGSNVGAARLFRGSTSIAESTGFSTSNAIRVVGGDGTAGNFSVTYLDSPATTSATTYKLQAICNTGTWYLNRRTYAADYGSVSSITLYEVSA